MNPKFLRICSSMQQEECDVHSLALVSSLDDVLWVDRLSFTLLSADLWFLYLNFNSFSSLARTKPKHLTASSSIGFKYKTNMKIWFNICSQNLKKFKFTHLLIRKKFKFQLCAIFIEASLCQRLWLQCFRFNVQFSDRPSLARGPNVGDQTCVFVQYLLTDSWVG